MEQPVWNFEQEPFVDEDPDETSINLRAYFDRMPDEKMREYQPKWSDEEVIDWCGDFKDDGMLMTACCERDVDVAEFRRVLQQAMVYRDRVRGALTGAGKMNQPAWHCEYAVEAEVSTMFAWNYWTDIRNWEDPPAQFSLDGAFVAGSQGMTRMPGQEPLRWLIAEVEVGKSARIRMQLDRAMMSFHWRFEGLSDGRTRITQHIELTGENSAAYAEARSAFSANLPDGMKKIAAAMSQAAVATSSG